MLHNFKLLNNGLYINKVDSLGLGSNIDSLKTVFNNLNKEKGRLAFLLQTKINKACSEQEFYSIYKEFYNFDVNMLYDLYAKKLFNEYKEIIIASDEIIRVTADNKGHYFFDNKHTKFYSKEQFEKESGDYKSVFFQTDYVVIVPSCMVLNKNEFCLKEIKDMAKNGNLIVKDKVYNKQKDYNEYAKSYEKNKNIKVDSLKEIISFGNADEISRNYKGVLNVLKEDLSTNQMFRDYKLYSQKCNDILENAKWEIERKRSHLKDVKNELNKLEF